MHGPARAHLPARRASAGASKELTAASLPIRRMPFPDELVLPLRQHAGKPAKPWCAWRSRCARRHGGRGRRLHVRADPRIGGGPRDRHRVVAASGWQCGGGVRIAVDRWSPQIPRPRSVPHWEGLDAGRRRACGAERRRRRSRRCGVPRAREAGAAEGREDRAAHRERRGVRAVPDHRPSHDGRVPGARALRRPRHDARARRAARGDRRRDEQARRHRGGCARPVPSDLDVTVQPSR
jgi:hypothetical protein